MTKFWMKMILAVGCLMVLVNLSASSAKACIGIDCDFLAGHTCGGNTPGSCDNVSGIGNWRVEHIISQSPAFEACVWVWHTTPGICFTYNSGCNQQYQEELVWHCWTGPFTQEEIDYLCPASVPFSYLEMVANCEDWVDPGLACGRKYDPDCESKTQSVGYYEDIVEFIGIPLSWDEYGACYTTGEACTEGGFCEYCTAYYDLYGALTESIEHCALGCDEHEPEHDMCALTGEFPHFLNYTNFTPPTFQQCECGNHELEEPPVFKEGGSEHIARPETYDGCSACE